MNSIKFYITVIITLASCSGFTPTTTELFESYINNSKPDFIENLEGKGSDTFPTLFSWGFFRYDAD